MLPREDGALMENQGRLRRANERLHERVAGIVRDDQRIPFLCECADESCVEPVLLTLDDYARVRDADMRFLIVPGHPTIEGENVVAEGDGYLIVEKPAA